MLRRNTSAPILFLFSSLCFAYKILPIRIGIIDMDILSYDTREVSLTQQQDYWQDAISRVFVPLDCQITSDLKFHGALQLKRWEHLSVASVSSSAQRVKRNLLKYKNDTNDHVLMSLIQSGSMGISQNGREAILQPGQFAFYDSFHSYNLHLENESDQLVVMFPRKLFSDRLIKIDKLTAYSFGQNHPLMHLLTNFVQSLFQLPQELSEDIQSTVLNQYLDLLMSVLNQSTTGQNQHKDHQLMFQIQSEIIKNLQHDSLSIHDIAKKINVSSRYISKIFQNNDSTFGKFLLEARLKKSHKLLSSPQAHLQSISEIAYISGFHDVSYFSREFKKMFGLTPREYRFSSSSA